MFCYDDCPCGLDEDVKKDFDETEKEIKTARNGPVSVDNCSKFDNEKMGMKEDELDDMIVFLRAVENNF